MDFSAQILRTGALVVLTGGTIVGSIVAGNRIGTLLTNRSRKDEELDKNDSEDNDKVEDRGYEYKYIEEYQAQYDKINKDEDEDEDEYEDEDGEELNIAKLERMLNGTKIHEITPNGDVIMHYDTKLESFVYYCDDKSIPYKYLETVARKYCLDNDCIAIFVNMYDELKKGIERQKEAKIKKCKDDANKDSDREKDNQRVNNDVFASFKQYNKTNPKELIKQRKYITKENANRYSYRGNIAAGRELRIENPKKKVVGTAAVVSSLDETIPTKIPESTSYIKTPLPGRKKISFADFKHMKNSTSVDTLPVKTLEEWVESDNEPTTDAKIDSPTFSPKRRKNKNPDSEMTINESDLTDLLVE